MREKLLALASKHCSLSLAMERGWADEQLRSQFLETAQEAESLEALQKSLQLLERAMAQTTKPVNEETKEGEEGPRSVKGKGRTQTTRRR